MEKKRIKVSFCCNYTITETGEAKWHTDTNDTRLLI